jgi:hypothetical protein
MPEVMRVPISEIKVFKEILKEEFNRTQEGAKLGFK